MPYEIVRTPDGREILVPVQDASARQLPSAYARHQPPVVHPRYAPPEPIYDDYPRSRRRKRKRHRMSIETSPKFVVFSGFILSWFWCGVGLPGFTLLTWAFLAIYMFKKLKS